MEVRGRSKFRWFAEGMALSCDTDGRGWSSSEDDVPCTAALGLAQRSCCEAVLCCPVPDDGYVSQGLLSMLLLEAGGAHSACAGRTATVQYHRHGSWHGGTSLPP